MKKILFALALVLTLALTTSCASKKDRFFSDYEALIEKTVETGKKAKSGDQNAIDALSDLLIDVTKIQEKYGSTIEKLSDAEKLRVAAMSMKLANVGM